jgi:hypothetical protein
VQNLSKLEKQADHPRAKRNSLNSFLGQYIQCVIKGKSVLHCHRQFVSLRRAPKTDGVSRMLKSASALRRSRGLCGEAKVYNKAHGYLKKRTQWMRYHLYKRQKLPLGSGITEAGCKIVFTQRLKRSGMSWTIEGGQVILDLRVIKLSRVWNAVHQKYLASKPMPVVQLEASKTAPHGRLAA